MSSTRSCLNKPITWILLAGALAALQPARQLALLLLALATRAGLLDGLAWHWSGRLWLATALHFTLNLSHLLLFTYPALHH